jgi:hypothetical protein
MMVMRIQVMGQMQTFQKLGELTRENIRDRQKKP